MSTTQPDGGPAFPLFFPESKTREGKTIRSRDECPGMSLRDYFAGQALAVFDHVSLKAIHNEARAQNTEPPVLIAIAAYGLADAMLKARMLREAGR